MATWAHSGVVNSCGNCGCALMEHDRDGRCPRDVSQPVSHVVAGPQPATDREALGREVRRVWVSWAQEQPAPKPSWLAPWEDLGEPDREVDRRIGERLFAMGYDAATGRVDAFHALTAEQRAALLRIREDGGKLLEAARALRDHTTWGDGDASEAKLCDIATRIDARKC